MFDKNRTGLMNLFQLWVITFSILILVISKCF